MGVGWIKICCSVGLKGAEQRFMAELSTVLFSAEGWLFILSLGEIDAYVPNLKMETQEPMRLSMKNPKNHSLTFWNHPPGC